MPKYFYIAKSQKGEIYSSHKEAKDEQGLTRILRQEGCVLILARPLSSNKNIFALERGLFSFGGVSLEEKIMLVQNLKAMVFAGIPIPQALKFLAEQSKGKKLKKALLGISEKIIKGEKFSEALASYPNIFSQLFCSIVRAGEESGTLGKNLEILAKQMERENASKAKIQEAMRYPSVIILAMVGISAVILMMVVPRLAEIFEQLEVKLPITTKIIVGLGIFLAENWYLVVFVLVIILLLNKVFLKIKKIKVALDRLVLKVPVVSTIVKKINSAYTVRTLSFLIAAGVPLVRSLEIVAETLDNSLYKEAIVAGIEKVKRGEKFSAVLSFYHHLYPLTVVQMIEVGEETGKTSKILEALDDFFEKEVLRITKNLVAVIEPVLMLIIGAAVGFFAISIVQPVCSIFQSMR